MNIKIKQMIDKAIADEEAYQRWQSDIIFSRLPLWKQTVLEGDRLSDGSDEQGWDKEQEWPED
jgi:hypothetical protein